MIGDSKFNNIDLIEKIFRLMVCIIVLRMIGQTVFNICVNNYTVLQEIVSPQLMSLTGYMNAIIQGVTYLIFISVARNILELISRVL
jgi:hypothetical protein